MRPDLDLLGLAAAVLLLEALHRANLVARRKILPADAGWMLAVGVVGAACAVQFEDATRFLEPAIGLVVWNLIRGAAGLLPPDARFLERWRYVPVAGVHVLVRDPAWTYGIFVLLAFRRRNFRFLLLVATRRLGPLRISAVDADQILPEPVRYERSKREKGVALVELIVSMTLLATVSAAVFTAVVQRSLRVGQVREHAAVREAAVSVIERAGAADWDELLARDGARFAVPGDGSEGRIEVEEVEPGLARITVVAPRRAGTPVELATYRAREEGR